MRESMPRRETPEGEPKPISQDAIIAAYQPFIEAGIKSPDEIDLDGEKAKAANGLFYAWLEQLDKKAGDDAIEQARANLLKTMIYVEAGFTDPDYLDEVLNEWLVQDEQNAEELPDSPEKDKLLSEIAAAKEKIEKILEARSDTGM